MLLTLDQMRRAAKARLTSPAVINATQFLTAIDAHGARFGLDQAHRLAQLVGQLMHESADFRFDREVWGPTPAQARYEGRTDLGNAEPGDGFLFRGRGPIQITGRANARAFRDWCEAQGFAPPDFEADPDAMLSDPWEGLGPLWYWDTRGLNRFADRGDAEMITRRINGGLNGYADRLDRLVRISLVLLDRDPGDVPGFQRHAGLVVDGIAGPMTRAALHSSLRSLPHLKGD